MKCCAHFRVELWNSALVFTVLVWDLVWSSRAQHARLSLSHLHVLGLESLKCVKTLTVLRLKEYIWSGCCPLILKEDGNNVSLHIFDSATLYVDYSYLNTDQRRRFAQVSHEYVLPGHGHSFLVARSLAWQWWTGVKNEQNHNYKEKTILMIKISWLQRWRLRL